MNISESFLSVIVVLDLVQHKEVVISFVFSRYYVNYMVSLDQLLSILVDGKCIDCVLGWIELRCFGSLDIMHITQLVAQVVIFDKAHSNSVLLREQMKLSFAFGLQNECYKQS